jgi:hypothetical protein
MKFIKIRDLKYVTANNSHIDLYATCKEYGEIPMTLNLVDIEDIHTYIDEDGIETPLEAYCKTLKIAPYVEPLPVVVIPTSITMRQARLHLLDLVLLDDIEGFISQDRKWQIEWEYATEILRNSQLIEAVKTSLGLDDDAVDDMFIKASKL